MSASMESILKGYEDPRLPMYFHPAKNTGLYNGIRNGLSIVQMSEPFNHNDNNSNVVPRFQNAADVTEPHTIYVAAETWFNIAEAAVNGWNVGSYTAKQAYENGITESLKQWGVGGAAAAYIASTKTPAAFAGPAPYAARHFLISRLLLVLQKRYKGNKSVRRNGFPYTRE